MVQDHNPARHPRNTNENSKPPPNNTHHLRTSTNHRSKVSLRELFINMAAGMDDGRTTDGRRTTAHKFARPAPATGESSRARSFARSHARTQRKRKRNRNRFPGSGVRLTPVSLPPTSDRYIKIRINICTLEVGGVVQALVLPPNREIDFDCACVCVACVRASERSCERETILQWLGLGARICGSSSSVRPSGRPC